MANKLTDKQERFCNEYIIDLNGTKAAIRAGYSEKTAKDIGCQTLAKTYIRNRINELSPEHIHKQRVKKYSDDKLNVGFIYVIKCSGSHYYKIGKSRNGGKQRMRSMQTGIPYDLELIKEVKIEFIDKAEKELHSIFKDNRVRGEWFLFTDTQLNVLFNSIENYIK